MKSLQKTEESTHFQSGAQVVVEKANVNNLKQVSLSFPRNAVVVFTGVSGSGKSSLAFDTIFHEGQRRYIESLSTYARQFLGNIQKPDIERIEGLSPAIAITQKTTASGYRSTVGTVTEVFDYLRLLYAKVGQPFDPETGEKLIQQTQESIFNAINGLPVNSKVEVMSPVVRGRKGEYNAQFVQWLKEGYVRARVDGDMKLLDELPEGYRLERHQIHTIELVIDRLLLKPDETSANRLRNAIVEALKKSNGYIVFRVTAPGQSGQKASPEELAFSTHFSSKNQTQIKEIAPRLFSFNSPYGACPACKGLGICFGIDPDCVVPDPSKSLEEGAIVPLQRLTGRSFKRFLNVLDTEVGISIKTPFNQLPAKKQNFLLYGKSKPAQISLEIDELDGAEGRNDTAVMKKDNPYSFGFNDWVAHFNGIAVALEAQFKTGSQTLKTYIRTFMKELPCCVCEGARLSPFSLSIRLPAVTTDQKTQFPSGLNINELSQLTLQPLLQYIQSLSAFLDPVQQQVSRQPLYEAEQRLHFLIDVGLSYLTLNRAVSTLSGGEAQRIRLAAQLGAKMSGVLYVLDEPSIGLHQYNNNQLIKTLLKLRDHGNSVLVVEHDEDTIQAADWLVDIGPLAGKLGGEIVFSGTPKGITDCVQSLTGQYLSGKKQIVVPKSTRPATGQALILHQANRYNLKNLTVSFPLATLTVVTGLSGSGKSTLIFDLLYPAVKHHLDPKQPNPWGYQALSGVSHIDKLINIDQSPIGRTSRSNPATYTGLMDSIRRIFANTETAKVRGYSIGQFSFNVAGGRCEHCKGEGYIVKSLSVLPDVHILCDYCKGKRYSPETLAVYYQGKTIADVLAMTIEEAVLFFDHQPKLKKWLQVLVDVGLNYLQLGQPAPMLSGGEAQRLKLATEFCKQSTGKTLYLLDEPSVGLHWADLENLLLILNRLVDQGNTVIMIEHNLDLIKVADHVIDMGPEGGNHGGDLVASGTPEKLAENSVSYTGQFLKRFF
ncbi:MAG: excinuclease ABC subunit UvrA [Cyanobacteria bacterium P01_H01_bin.74]